MAVKIRLMRIGTKKRPFYRVVAVDEKKKRTGGYLENLGYYNPLTHPKEIVLKQDRIDEWLKKGAQKSDGFLRIIGEAPQRPPRKVKKEKKEEVPAPAAAPAPTPEGESEVPTQTVEETPESAPEEATQSEAEAPAQEVTETPEQPEEPQLEPETPVEDSEPKPEGE